MVASSRTFVMIGAVSAFVAVGAGAFGAHALRSRLDAHFLNVFETGVRYHMYHALGLLAVGWAMSRNPLPSINIAGVLFVAGIVLFSGSLYMMTFTGFRWLGAITPLGGLAFIVGWVLLAWGASRPS